MSKVTAAVIQNAGGFDPARAVTRTLEWIAEAASTGARLVVFPEAFIGGYPKGADFGARVGLRTPAGRRQFEQYARGAIAVPGPETMRIGEAARQHRVHVILGVIERDLGTLYCTVLCFSETGELLGKRRKVMPTAMERLIWGFGDGSTLNVWDTSLGRVSAVICWENYML